MDNLTIGKVLHDEFIIKYCVSLTPYKSQTGKKYGQGGKKVTCIK